MPGINGDFHTGIAKFTYSIFLSLLSYASFAVLGDKVLSVPQMRRSRRQKLPKDKLLYPRWRSGGGNLAGGSI